MSALMELEIVSQHFRQFQKEQPDSAQGEEQEAISERHE